MLMPLPDDGDDDPTAFSHVQNTWVRGVQTPEAQHVFGIIEPDWSISPAHCSPSWAMPVQSVNEAEAALPAGPRPSGAIIASVGSVVGMVDGIFVGIFDGSAVGLIVGCMVGFAVGAGEGSGVGVLVGGLHWSDPAVRYRLTPFSLR